MIVTLAAAAVSAAAAADTAAAAITSWPAVVALLIGVLGAQVPSLVSTVRTHRDTKVIREHTENAHADAEHPNLRDELTATRLAAEAAAQAAQEAATTAAEAKTVATDTAAALERHTAQADEWQSAVENDLSRLRRPLFSWR